MWHSYCWKRNEFEGEIKQTRLTSNMNWSKSHYRNWCLPAETNFVFRQVSQMCPVGRSGHLCDEKLCVPNGFSPRGCRLRQQGMAAYEGARQEAVRRQLCTDAIHRSRWSRGISWYFGILLRDLHVLFSMVFSGFIMVEITITSSFVWSCGPSWFW